MERSLYISAGGHAALLGFALFGGLFTAEPLELPTVDVSVISEAEFAALTRRSEPPEPVETPLPQPAAPEPEEVAPVVPVPEARPELPAPTPPVIETPQPPTPLPDPVTQPPEVVIPPVQTEPDRAPQTSERPKPRPAPRVAPEAIAPPEPEVEIDNTAQPAVTETPDASETRETQSETAQEEAATEIVTEAEQPSATAPGQSLRPRSRPATAQQTAQPAQSQPADASDTAAAVNAALAEALGEPDAAPSPSGPPLTASEANTLRLAVQNCWVVDVGSQAANVTVIVAMNMDRRGKVVPGSLRLASSEGGSEAAVQTAFQAARRAILRCQKEGYELPVDKYEQWKQIEMTFNPKEMRVR